MKNPALSIVLLSNNRREDTLACLASLFRSDYVDFKVIVLDNGSVDGSVSEIRNQYPHIQMIPLTENLGYAGNNNIGVKLALEQGAEWILILNDDTVLESTCLANLMHGMVANPEIGIAGPMVYHFNEPDVIQSAGGILGKYWNSSHLGQNELDRGQYSKLHSVDWISGCAILVRRAVIEQVGMLDPNYFLYWEETEWCLRASRAGWKIAHIPQAKLWHKGVQRNYQPKPYVTYYITRNHLFTLAKHHAPLLVWIYTLLEIVRTLVSWTVKPRWRFKRKHRDAMWHGLIDFILRRQGPMPSQAVS